MKKTASVQMVDSSIARRDKKGPVQSFHLRRSARNLEELCFLAFAWGREERGADPTDVTERISNLYQI